LELSVTALNATPLYTRLSNKKSELPYRMRNSDKITGLFYGFFLRTQIDTVEAGAAYI